MVNSAIQPDETLYQVAATAISSSTSAKRPPTGDAKAEVSSVPPVLARRRRLRAAATLEMRSDERGIAANRRKKRVEKERYLMGRDRGRLTRMEPRGSERHRWASREAE